MSADITGFEDVSKERRSKVWINMLFHKNKGLALCKICLEKQFTRIVYAKNGLVQSDPEIDEDSDEETLMIK